MIYNIEIWYSLSNQKLAYFCPFLDQKVTLSPHISNKQVWLGFSKVVCQIIQHIGLGIRIFMISYVKKFRIFTI